MFHIFHVIEPSGIVYAFEFFALWSAEFNMAKKGTTAILIIGDARHSMKYHMLVDVCWMLLLS
jgi:fibrillarin-like rRNA methylase